MNQARRSMFDAALDGAAIGVAMVSLTLLIGWLLLL
jgi:hypothetical protein